jgi:tetratricopeptide (TPR) repeat protein
MFARRAPLAALALAAFALTATARYALEPEASPKEAVRDPAWLPSGRVLRAASCGQRLVLADLYWLRAVQYVGETVLAKVPRWDALYPLAEIVTDLDPRFGYAYQVAGSNLAGLAGRHGEAERILKKGMRNVPDRWNLYFVHATNKFLFEQDYAEAAEYARRAAVVGKRPYLALLAANLSALANTDDEYAAALSFLEQMHGQSDTPELKEELREREVKIRTYQALATLEHAVEAYRARTGRPPFALEALVPGELPSLPADPSGGRFLFEPATGRVQSSLIGPRAPLRVTR